jgi:hypothetical protein
MFCFDTDTLPQVRLSNPSNQVVMQLRVFFQLVGGGDIN